MNTVALEASVKEAIELLKKLGLFLGKGDKLIGVHSSEFKKVSRGNKHTEIHACAIKNRDFEIVLTDDSIFQFSVEKDMIRFAFIQNPNVFVTKQDFIGSIYSPEELLPLSEEEFEDLLLSLSDEEYQQFLNEQELNLNSHVIRYDMTLLGYAPLIHSYSHIHIGLNENLRIPCSKAITPLMFVLFCMKHTYYQEWKDTFTNDNELSKLLDDSKKQCIPIDAQYWCREETFELFLN